MLQAEKNYLTFLVLRLGLFCFLLTGIISCSKINISSISAIATNVTTIQKIQSQPKIDTTVYIQGKVEKQVPLIKGQAYLINDSTGKIWVITNQTNLRKGEQAVIKGKVRYQSIPLGGQEFGEVYIEE